jgi:DNA-binding transcriptional regulator YiaG
MTPTQIKHLRHDRGLSVDAMAEMLGVSRMAVNKWEQGQRVPAGPALILLQALRNGTVTAGGAVWSVRLLPAPPPRSP